MPAFTTTYYLVLAACLLLGLGLLLAAWRRPNRRRLLPRLLAGAVAAAALWLSAYPPTRAVEGRAGEAILLTTNYSSDTLRALRRQLGAGAPVWSYGLPAPAGTRPLGSLLALAERHPAPTLLHVLGQGLPPADQPMLSTVPVRWHPAAFRGIEAAYWPRRLVLGQVLAVEGRAHPGGTSPAWVRLRGAGAPPDSVLVPAGGGTFQLQLRPRVAGLLLPSLELHQAGHVLAAEPVPVEVTAAPQPPVLLLAAAPGFEFKFLKNSLAAGGRAVALRTPVSRGLVQTEVVNQPAQSLDHLTPALLARYPLAVADADALAALPPAESQALRTAVQAGRLGLVVLAGARPLSAAVPGRAAFSARALVAGAPVPVALVEPAGAGQPLPALLPASLRPAAGLRPLATAGPGRALVAAARRVALGQVVVSVVPETFRWALQGATTGYEAYWSQLLAAALPPATSAATWQLAESWPHPGEPLTLQLATGRLPAPTTPLAVRALAGGPATPLALAQDPRLPEWSTAPYWPGAAGWHEVRGPGTATYRFFVFGPAAWRGPGQLAPVRPAKAGLAGSHSTRREPWPAEWFFSLFVLAVGFLWLEEKL